MSEPQTQIGKLIDGDVQRDAIHIAVAPAVAAHRLGPGEAVGFVSDDHETVGRDVTPIGIVDPFLPTAVRSGERFWLFLFPNTITSLKHVWTHPAFVADASRPDPKAASEAWLRDFIARADCPRYETVMAAIVGDPIAGDDDSDYISSRIEQDSLHFSGVDACGEIPPEFWEHAEIVTGRKFGKRPSYFSCAC